MGNGKATYALKSYVETDTEYPGTFSVILSTPVLDRDNEVVESKCFTASKAMPPRISMDLDHGLTVLDTVGSGIPSYTTDGELQVDGEWARTDKAQEARSLVRDGHVAYTSVTYRVLKTKMIAGVRHITDAELLNGTFTQIPTNPTARVLAAKSGARHSAADAKSLQTAHDALVSMGADCSTGEKSHRRSTMTPGGWVEIKAIVGSVEALQDRVCDALEDLYTEASSDWAMCMTRGVIPDGDAGGTVIFQAYGTALDSDETYKQAYTDDGKVVTLTGEASIVDIAEIVTPDADAAEVDEATTVAAKAATVAAEDAERFAFLVRLEATAAAARLV